MPTDLNYLIPMGETLELTKQTRVPSPKSLSEEGGREEGQGRATGAGETWKTWGLVLLSAWLARESAHGD